MQTIILVVNHIINSYERVYTRNCDVANLSISLELLQGLSVPSNLSPAAYDSN